MTHRVFLGMGSNAGDRLGHLRRAVASLPDVIRVSPVYETEAVGDRHGAANHFNLVVELATDSTPQHVLRLCQEAERAAGREGEQVGMPVPLDVDVLLFDDLHIDEPGLQVPHPRMWSRRFVLQPLADLSPDLVPQDLLKEAVGWIRSIGSLE